MMDEKGKLTQWMVSDGSGDVGDIAQNRKGTAKGVFQLCHYHLILSL
jgi:hypothetical protein